ncbi:MAG: glycosyltransferase family 2 protein [Sphingobacteriales bacterium]|nr:glycosyltransferase family 2 protein [Sphingobacteriales bacterium]
MISILIPIYNFPVYDLVKQLAEQAKVLGVDYEIICIDDASSQHITDNESINSIENTHYSILEKNIGRSKLRNLLASKAKFPYLLFIDTDMKLLSDQFLHHYIVAAEQSDVLYGGISYEEQATQKHELRLKYGQKREAIPVKLRVQDPYFSVKTCNLWIKKSVFDLIKFNESILQYGHEDTLFSIELERQQVSVQHIDNPTLHLGVERSDIYLNKVEVACKSLSYISTSFLSAKEQDEIRLIYFYNRLNKMGLMPILSMLYRVLENRIVRNLISDQPNLLLLDYFKLMAYSKALKS